MPKHCAQLLGFSLVTFLMLGGTLAQGQKSSPLAEVFQAIHRGQIKVVDLTHPLDEHSPYWPEGSNRSPFHASQVAGIDREGYFARTLAMPEHFGTHMDAPAHFAAEGFTVDRIAPENFLGTAVVVDVSEGARSNSDYRVTVQDLEKWVKAHGPVPRGCLVFFRTGWARRWPSQKDYMNQDAQGVLHFPGLTLEAARALLDQAHPVAIGIDTASIDYGASKNFEVHHLTMRTGLYHLENVANLEQLPATGAYVIALPLKLRGGSGSPTRVIALFEKKSEVRSQKSE